jgi:hypothetical protein
MSIKRGTGMRRLEGDGSRVRAMAWMIHVVNVLFGGKVGSDLFHS